MHCWPPFGPGLAQCSQFLPLRLADPAGCSNLVPVPLALARDVRDLSLSLACSLAGGWVTSQISQPKCRQVRTLTTRFTNPAYASDPSRRVTPYSCSYTPSGRVRVSITVSAISVRATPVLARCPLAHWQHAVACRPRQQWKTKPPATVASVRSPRL